MYNRFSFTPGENSVIGKMFASPATTVETILSHKGIPDYLQTFADPVATPKSVLSFVEREMPALLDYARQSSSSFSASDSLRGHGDALADSSNGSVPVPISPGAVSLESPLTDGLTVAGDADTQHLVPTAAAPSSSPTSSLANGGSRPLLSGITGVTTIIRHPRRRGSTASADGTTRLSSGSETDDSQRNSASPPGGSARFVNKTLASINATELLAAYIASTRSAEAIHEIVPVSLAMLSSPCVENTSLATSVQRLLLAAFDADFVITTDVINATLTGELVAGCVHNLCRSSIVVETIIALFGSALSAVLMMAPTTDTTMFTSGWIQNDLVRHICDAVSGILHDPSLYNFFYFLKELLKRGFSHSAGPVVDIFLAYECLAPLLEQVLQVAEAVTETVSLDSAHHSVPTPHLAGEGIVVWSYAVGMLRKSLPVTETPDMYACTCDYIGPVRLVREHADRLIALLTSNLPCPVTRSDCLPREPPILPCPFAGLVRVSICTLFVELGQYNVSQSDAVLVESGFVAAFARVCRAFPRNDALSRLLHTFVLNIFHRKPLPGETVTEAVSRDRLLSHLASQAESGCSDGLLARLVEFANDDALQTLSLSTFAIDALKQIVGTPWCAKTSGGALCAAVQPFLGNGPLQQRLHDMTDAITGTAYRARGSAHLPAVVHHPTLNFATAEMPRALSLSTSVEDAPTGAAGESTDILPSDASALSAVSDGPNASVLYTVVPFVSAVPTEEPAAAEINIDDLHRETQALKESGSPQLQAYPSFSSMRLSFGSEDAAAAPPPEMTDALEALTVSEGAAPSVVEAADVVHRKTVPHDTSATSVPTASPEPATTEDTAAAPAVSASPALPAAASAPAAGSPHVVVAPHPSSLNGTPDPARPQPVRKKMPPGLLAEGKSGS